MNYFRSQKMGYYNLIMPRESAWEILNELGENGTLHFIEEEKKDLINRPFIKFIKRCEEIKFKLNYIVEIGKRFNKNLTLTATNEKLILNNLKEFLLNRSKAGKSYFEEVENEIEEKMKYLTEQIRQYDDIIEKRNKLIEYKEVLNVTKTVLGSSIVFIQKGVNKNEGPIIKMINKSMNNDIDEQDDIRPLSISDVGEIKISFTAGIINKEDFLRFKRLIFRVSKGHVWSEIFDMNLADKNEENEGYKMAKKKSIFLILYSSGETEMLKKKIIRVLESFGAEKYNIPEDYTSFSEKLNSCEKQLGEINNIIKLTESSIKNVLDYYYRGRNNNDHCSYYEELSIFVKKEKSIYETMNILSLKNSIYHGKCWCPKDKEELVVKKLHDLARKQPDIAGGQLQETNKPDNKSPPTYFKTNDFTFIFQEIVDTYGVPRYREVNPAIFTIITFPFLFGMMFGDLGHGLLVTIFGLYLVFNNQKIIKTNSAFIYFSKARYLILLMGFFSAYAGLIYNEYFYLSLDIFGSCYDNKELIRTSEECVYSIGLDPVWFITSKEIEFHNSYKMKMSVIFGVIQMTLGIILKALNTIHDKNMMDFFFEFVPQLIFMIFTFGYMILLIFIKWGVNWKDTHLAPSIISTMINIPIKLGSTENTPTWGESDGSEQEEFQKVLIIIVVISVLMMLLPKPLIAYVKKKIADRDYFTKYSEKEAILLIPEQKENLNLFEIEMQEKNINVEKNFESKVEQKKQDHDEHSLEQVVVHTLIENIEFILGTVSNTASYLRLWALSLAHGQLSKVFFEKTLKSPIEDGNILMILIGYLVFGHITFAILLCMDFLECFLHSLRLHWVEFQNKFYKADGYKFKPFSFGFGDEIH